jgi:hypothetical protein
MSDRIRRFLRLAWFAALLTLGSAVYPTGGW